MIGYLDLPSGFSGDMALGSLVDAGWPVGRLREVVSGLGDVAAGVVIDSKPVMRNAIRATLVAVSAPEQHQHRHLSHIRRIIEAATLPAAVKGRALAVFERLAAAEAKVHGTTVEKVHFHEVGAVDAIVDIVGTVAGLHELNIDRLHASPPALGGGWAKTEHGLIPVPAPATLELLAAVGAPTCNGPGEGELLTPTGAALLAELATFSRPPMRLSRIGQGAGGRECAWPNVARLWLGEPAEDSAMVVLETNIDDMNPQWYEPALARLFEAGAVDAWLTPIQMKKNRPAVMLSALAPAQKQAAVADAMLRHTTTLGVRVRGVERHEAEREIRNISTPWGTVRVKVKRLGGEILSAMPEYEDCRALAEAAGVPIRAVHDAAVAAGAGAGAGAGT